MKKRIQSLDEFIFEQDEYAFTKAIAEDITKQGGFFYEDPDTSHDTTVYAISKKKISPKDTIKMFKSGRPFDNKTGMFSLELGKDLHGDDIDNVKDAFSEAGFSTRNIDKYANMFL